MANEMPEKRKHPRISGRFVVSYRIQEEVDSVDISQTKNLSLGGMLLTTNKIFPPGTNLAILIKLPFFPKGLNLVARVLESKVVVKDLIYDTRLEFLGIDEESQTALTKTVEQYLRRS